MKRKKKWSWFIIISILTAVIDRFVIRSGIIATIPMTQSYIIGSWFLIWVAYVYIFRVVGCSFRTKRGIWHIVESGGLAALATGATAQCEDFLFMCMCAVFDGRPLYPLYCHEWLTTRVWIGFAPLNRNWLGVPSGYYFGVIALMHLVIFERKNKGGEK